jgi:hypothetical protein
MVSIQPTQWAYAAGFVDGEGCITSYRNSVSGYYYVRIRVGQRDREVLDWLKDHFGGRIWFRPHSGLSDKGSYTWGLECGAAKPFLRGIYPYMRVKKKQAKLAYFLTYCRKDQQEELHQMLKDAKRASRT